MRVAHYAFLAMTRSGRGGRCNPAEAVAAPQCRCCTDVGQQVE